MGSPALRTNQTDPTKIGWHGVSRVLVAGSALTLVFVAGSVKALNGDNRFDAGLGIAEMLMGPILFSVCLMYRTIVPIAALYGAFLGYRAALALGGGGDCGCLPESVAQLPRLLFEVWFYLVVFAVTAQCILEGATARKMFLLVSAFGVGTLISSSALVEADRTLDFCSLIRKEFGEGFHGTVLVVDPSCGKCETELMAVGWHTGSHEVNAVIFSQSSVESLTAMTPLLAPTVLRMQVDLGSHMRQKVPFRVRCAKGVL